MLSIVLKGKWFLIMDFSYMMNHAAWVIFLVAFIFCSCIFIWYVFRKPLSRFMKVKHAYVEVLYVPRGVLDRDVVGVRFIKPKKMFRKGFFMKAEGMRIGDRGVLHYQGVYGLGFEADAKIEKTMYYQRYNFAKHKKEENLKNKADVHKKRKYW